MDARSKASFINAVADGQLLVCPNCQFGNPLDSRFCIKCGHQLKENKPVDTAPAFAAVEETPAASQSPAFASVEESPAVSQSPAFASVEETPAVSQSPAFASVEETPAVSQSPAFAAVEEKAAKTKAPAFASVPVVQEEEEPKSAFAQGLPEWSLEPPMMVVRRK